MVDLVKLIIKAGNGGDGRISFLSNRRSIKGGPDGGDGGDGGSVIAVATPHQNTLRDFAGISVLDAENGHMGGSQNMHGKNADDVRVQLPIGTRIWRIVDSYHHNEPKRMYKNDKDLGRVERAIERRASAVITESDGVWELRDQAYNDYKNYNDYTKTKVMLYADKEYTVQLVGDLTEENQEIVIARGGRGGRGNETFKSSKLTTPMEAQTGEGGEWGEYIFELLLLADVGLVGLPNAGKSTLLSVLTKATPKIANYPFTTLEPNLGVMTIDAANKEDRRSVVIADIPGLIEGASEGKGLGHAFLRHISRCKTLIFLLALEDATLLQNAEDPTYIADELVKQYHDLEHELSTYATDHDLSEEMKRKQRRIVFSKADLLSQDTKGKIISLCEEKMLHGFWISSATGEGISHLKEMVQ